MSNRIKNKYFCQKLTGLLKITNKKAANYLGKAGYIDTVDLETVDYNNDDNLTDLDNTDLKKISGKQITPKKIVKKYRNPARKKPY